MPRSTSDVFEEHERPTAKRGHLDPVDLANAANRTQELNPRELLGADVLERSAKADAPARTTSGTRSAVSPEEIEQFKKEPAPEASLEHATSSHPSMAIPSIDSPLPPVRITPEPIETPRESEPALPMRRALFVTRHEGRLVLTPALLLIAVMLAALGGVLLGRGL